MPPPSLLEQEVRLIAGHLEQNPASARRVPDSTARVRPKPKPAEDLPPLPAGTPDPTKKAIAEALETLTTGDNASTDSTRRAIAAALEEEDSSGTQPLDATRKILLEAKKEAEDAEAAEAKE
jgi:hypothetical protein